MSESTELLYDRASVDWTRTRPLLLSDYTARPFLLDWCKPIEGARILDLGCGEGYFARHLKRGGALSVEGIDLSRKMIERAKEQELRDDLGIRYRVGTAIALDCFPDESLDLVVAVFLFNYMDRKEMSRSMREIRRILKPGGRFVFAVPHPSLPFSGAQEPPFYFCPGEAGYFSGRDRLFEGEIFRLDGVAVPVRCVHKTFSDYFAAFAEVGFGLMPEVEELYVTMEMLDVDLNFFLPLLDQPLHAAFRLEKAS